MLKFFRRIRQNQLLEGKTSKYFKYAIGEIILVVIGILIALQINNWNENRKDRKLERSYVELLIRDLSADAKSLAKLDSTSNQSVLSKNIILAYQDGNISKPDSLDAHFLRALFNGIKNFVPNKGAIEEVQNAGGLSLITDEKVRNQVLELYNEYDRMEKNIGRNYLENRIIMRDLVFKKAKSNLFITHETLNEEILYPLLLDSELKDRLVNNWAATYNMSLKELVVINAETIKICKDYLQRFKK